MIKPNLPKFGQILQAIVEDLRGLMLYFVWHVENLEDFGAFRGFPAQRDQGGWGSTSCSSKVGAFPHSKPAGLFDRCFSGGGVYRTEAVGITHLI